ncbi:MAG: peptidylprolyl isomerase [Thermodesulfobacteriota bacterium]
MKKCIRSFLSVVLVCGCTACSANPGSDKAAVIRVGNRSIQGEDIKKIVKFTSFENDIPESVVWSSITSLVNKIVDNSLILEYGKDQGVELADIELERAIQDITKDYPGDSFKEMLLKRCIDYQDWKQRLRERLLMQKIVKERTESIGSVSYEAIRSYYEQRPDEFSHPSRVKFVHIVSSSREVAKELLSALKNGGNIQKIVQKQTCDQAVQLEGGIKWHSMDMLPPAISKAAFSLPIGQISPVIQTPYGFHVIKIVERELAGRKALPEVIDQIEEILLNKEQEAHYDRWLNQLRQQYLVAVNYTLLDSIRTTNGDS